jgi:dTDP-4-dehydrorhamnose reductase
MKLLVIGASGLLGFKVASLAVDRYETYATYNFRPIKLEGCTSFKLDKRNRDETMELAKRVKPNIIVDTAALHNVDYCESHPDESWKINVEGTRNVVDACKVVGAKMIFLSTDYVFDGTKGLYREEDPPNPLSVYAKNKLEAEKLIEKSGVSYGIGRPSVIYGWNALEASGLQSSSGKSMNFVIWAVNKLEKGEPINAVTDQYSSPTLADNLAEALLALSKRGKQGLYHTAGKSCVNRYELSKKIAEVFGFDLNLIKPVTSDAFKQAAVRPKKCCLNVTKAEKDLAVKLLTIEEGLNLMKKQMESASL